MTVRLTNLDKVLWPRLGLTKGWMVAHLDRPVTVVFDLDPGLPATVVDCCRVGLRIRELFAAVLTFEQGLPRGPAGRFGEGPPHA